MSHFLNYCDNHAIDFIHVKPVELQSFIADQSLEQKTPGSINRSLSVIRSFYRWMVRFNKRSDNPCGSLKNLKNPQKLPDVLWEKEMAGFAELPDNTGILWPERDKAIIMLMYSAGLRISELVSLDMENLLEKRDGARIIGKGGKERYVFFSEEGVNALNNYLPLREARLRASGFNHAVSRGRIFVNRKLKPISVPGVRWIISEYAQRSGLGKNVHPHCLRHRFATHLVNSGCDVRVVQELLGHASISTTQRYTHVNLENLKRIYSKAHPHAAKSVKTASGSQRGNKNGI